MGINDVRANDSLRQGTLNLVDVYNMNGQKLRSHVDRKDALTTVPQGLYVIPSSDRLQSKTIVKR